MVENGCVVAAVERVTALLALRPGGATAGVLPAMGRFIVWEGVTLARVGPGRVLAMREGVDGGLVELLAPIAEGAAVFDLSDQYVGARMQGDGALRRLGMLVPLDVERMPVGGCGATAMGHLAVTVWRTGVDAFGLCCGRSFGSSFHRALGLPGK